MNRTVSLVLAVVLMILPAIMVRAWSGSAGTRLKQAEATAKDAAVAAVSRSKPKAWRR